jgi:hypothetical protein
MEENRFYFVVVIMFGLIAGFLWAMRLNGDSSSPIIFPITMNIIQGLAVYRMYQNNQKY